MRARGRGRASARVRGQQWRPGRSPLVLYQALVVVGLAYAVVSLDLADRVSIRRFYLTLWGWFFFEYPAFAAAAWLAAP